MKRDESTTRTLHGCLREWNYETGVDAYGQDFSVSLACQLQFTQPPNQDTERFHEELQKRDITPLHPDAGRYATDEIPNYLGELMLRENRQRIKILVADSDRVRLSPLDGQVPGREQLGQIVEALEIGFGAYLAHNPIEMPPDGISETQT